MQNNNRLYTHIRTGALIFLSLIALASCFEAEEDSAIPVSKEIEISIKEKSDSEVAVKTVESTEKQQASHENLELQSRVEIDPRFVLLHTMLQNLDLDQIEERILILKPRDNPNSHIHISVIDFDTVSNQYINAWDGETGAANVRTFSISFADIVGDHILEIICSGTNEKGERTLDIFRKTLSPEGYGIYYTTICSITADGSIQIKKHERSKAYKLGQKNGLSYPIVAYSRDKSSNNVMDLVKYEYYWKYQENKYVRGRSEKIPGSDIAEQQLKELFTKDTADFEQFLQDPWFKQKQKQEQVPGPSELPEEMIVFDPDNRRIIFFSGNVQEIYTWENSHRTRIPNSIYISGSNKLVPFIEKRISIFVTAPDTIQLQVSDREFQSSNFDWNGTYNRLGASLQKTVLSEGKDDDSKGEITLEGVYANGEGGSLRFDYPHVTISDPDNTMKGLYTVYSLDSTILEIKVLSEARTVVEQRVYKIEQEIDGNGLIRILTLNLTPGTVGVSGFKPAEGKDKLLYQRIEEIKEDLSLKHRTRETLQTRIPSAG